MNDLPARHRTVAVLIAAFSSYLIFATTNRCFGEADVRNAIRMVQTLRADPDAKTIPQAILANHPHVRLQPITWSGEITDDFYGFVRVLAVVPAVEGARKTAERYLFDVNLTGQRVHPANEDSRLLMGGLQPSPSQEPAGVGDEASSTIHHGP